MSRTESNPLRPAGQDETRPAPRIANWEYHPDEEMPIALVSGKEDILLATGDESRAWLDISLANSRRIRAAWNAVEAAGLTTTALECGVLADLVASCKEMLDYLRDDNPGGFMGGDGHMTAIAERAEATLTKALGKE